MSAEPERMGDGGDDVEEMEEEEETKVDITSQILRRPDLLAALQGRLHAQMIQVSFTNVCIFTSMCCIGIIQFSVNSTHITCNKLFCYSNY